MKSHFCNWRATGISLLGLAFGIAAPVMSRAQVQRITLNFNDVLPGSDISTQYLATGVTFQPYPANPFIPGVYADNPGLGPNPTQANNALIGIFGAVQMFLPISSGSGYNSFVFDVLPDPSDPAGQSSVPVLFLNGSGNVVDTLNIDQTVAGSYFYRGGIFQSVVLPADADYDNIVAVPEPGSLMLMGALMVTTLGLLHKRRVTSRNMRG